VAHGDAETIELRGTLASFAARGLAISDSVRAPIAPDAPVTVSGADGHTWTICGDDPFAMYARRPRTESERVGWIDHQNARRVSSFFSADRAHTLVHIADHLERLAQTMPRGRRVARVRDSLAMAAFVLRDLTTSPSADMSGVREMLSLVNIHVPQLEVH
jgi:hypothetical protein